MAVLKFDQVTAPDFRGVSSILENASTSLGRAGKSAEQLFKDFNTSREEKAKSELLASLYRASPEEILNKNNNYLLNNGDKNYLDRISANNLLALSKVQDALRKEYFADKENKAFNSILYDFNNTPEEKLYSNQNNIFSQPGIKENFDNLSINNASKLAELYDSGRTAYFNRLEKDKEFNERKRQFDVQTAVNQNKQNKLDEQNKAYAKAISILTGIPKESLPKINPLSAIPEDILSLLNSNQINDILSRIDDQTKSVKSEINSNNARLTTDYLNKAIRDNISSDIALTNSIYQRAKSNLSQDDSKAINVLENTLKANTITNEAKKFLANLDDYTRSEGFSNRYRALGDANIREKFESLPDEIKAKVIELDPQLQNYNSNPEYIDLTPSESVTFTLGEDFTENSNNKAKNALAKAAAKEESKTEEKSSIDFSQINPDKVDDIKLALDFMEQKGINVANPLGNFNYPTFKPKDSSTRVVSPARTEEGRKLINLLTYGKKYDFLKDFSPEEQYFIKQFGDTYSSVEDLPSISMLSNTIELPSGKFIDNPYKYDPKVREAVKQYIANKNNFTIELPKEYYKNSEVPSSNNKATTLLKNADTPTTSISTPENAKEILTASASDFLDKNSKQSIKLEETTQNYTKEKNKIVYKFDTLARSFGTSYEKMREALGSNAPVGAESIGKTIDNVINVVRTNPKGASQEFIEDIAEDTEGIRYTLSKFILAAQQRGIPSSMVENVLLNNISRNNPLWRYLTGDSYDGSAANKGNMETALEGLSSLMKTFLLTQSDLTTLDKHQKTLTNLNNAIASARLANDAAKLRGNKGDQRYAAKYIESHILNNKNDIAEALTSYR